MDSQGQFQALDSEKVSARADFWVVLICGQVLHRKRNMASFKELTVEYYVYNACVSLDLVVYAKCLGNVKHFVRTADL